MPPREQIGPSVDFRGCVRTSIEACCAGSHVRLLDLRQRDIDFSHPPLYTVHMSELRFEWDEAKNRENIRKHGVSFEEARTVFLDEAAIRYYDPDHSRDEDRFIMLGMSAKLRVLVVCHCFRMNDALIRIISARKALKREARSYRS